MTVGRAVWGGSHDSLSGCGGVGGAFSLSHWWHAAFFLSARCIFISVFRTGGFASGDVGAHEKTVQCHSAR